MWSYLKNNEKNSSVFGEARTSDEIDEIDEQSFGRTVFNFPPTNTYIKDVAGKKQT